MDSNIRTSTPIVYEKLLPPPPRKLWATDSVTEQLYRNKWTKYRNSIEDDDSWSALEAPRFIDFDDIPDARDSYFDNAEDGKFATPQRTVERRLPGLDSQNNNILESFGRCCLSVVKKTDNENRLTSPPSTAVNLIDDLSEKIVKSAESTIKPTDQDKMDIETAKPSDNGDTSKMNAENNSSGRPTVERSNRSDNSKNHCTTVEPFSFESREKCKQAHRKARRERDRIGKEVWKGFRANPVPNYLKSRVQNREKNCSPETKNRPEQKKKMISDVDTKNLNKAVQIWKRKAFEPSHPKRASIAIKPPHLYTAIRAAERRRFDERMREKERQQEAAKKIEEEAKKKREEEEIAKLRRQLVHKAQPIRKYKLIIPTVEKRPLADPMTPITCKRRRKC